MTSLNIIKSLLIATTVTALFVIAGVNPAAQTAPPARTGRISDFAGVIDAKTHTRLEAILENLQLKTGIQFDVVTIQSTSGEDIFDYSGRMARDWNVGAVNTRKKSLLLVLSIDEKVSATRVSRSVQSDLPEDVLANMRQRTGTLLRVGQANTAASDAVEYFVVSLGRKFAFKLEDVDLSTATATAQASPDIPTAPVSTDANVETTPAVVLTSTEATRQRVVNLPSPTPQPIAANRPAEVQIERLSTDDENESEEVEVTLALPLAERITTLKKFIDDHPKSKSLPRAREILVSAHAALGDSMLGNRDSVGGVEQLMLAISEAPADASEKLYTGVIAQIPMNLYLRDERVAAFESAQKIEEKFGTDSHRLIGLTNFFLGIERGDEAARLAAKAVSLTPDSAEAHYTLGLALHISLRLDEAIAEYKRAVELDSSFRAAQRSLADLNRASGKTEEALTFYREQVAADPKDRAARSGLVLSLLDLSQKDDAERELEAALKDDSSNVTLLAGAAYWFAAHNDTKRALELARKAVEIEPRYTWSQIALARASVGEGRLLDAEHALRFARQYGKFPTLDYELASVLFSAGLYDEAAETLARSFALRNDQVETRLAGRITKAADNFIELLAPERQASLFQLTPADTAANASLLKALLAFSSAVAEANDDEKLISTAKAFASGDDKMRAYRQMYVASRLLRLNKGLDLARELADAARGGVEDAMESPAVTVAAQADELREIRARAIASGGPPDIAEAPREVLANILRGRIEDITGWALFNQDKYPEAVEHLQKAANVLPEATPSWRAAMWHLGAALEQTDRKEDALNAYIKSYLSGEPDLTRRALIERLYVQVNGSPDGLDQRIGPAPSTASASIQSPADAPAQPIASPEASATPVSTEAEAQPKASIPETTKTSERATPETSPSPQNEPSPVPSPSEEPSPTTPTESPEQPTTTPSPTPEATPASTPDESSKAESQPRPTSSEPSLADIPVKPPEVLKLTGRIKDSTGNPIANVVVVLISPRGSVIAATTDSEGVYTFTVSPSEKPVRLVPSKDGFIFDPIDKTVLMKTEDRAAIDFVGKEQP